MNTRRDPTPFAHAQGWDQAIAEEQQRCAARRARVLAHPDIAKRLTQRPMKYPSPDMWNGYVPPYLISGGNGDKVNSSPIRAQLISICQEVDARERQLEQPSLLDEDEPPPPEDEA